MGSRVVSPRDFGLSAHKSHQTVGLVCLHLNSDGDTARVDRKFCDFEARAGPVLLIGILFWEKGKRICRIQKRDRRVVLNLQISPLQILQFNKIRRLFTPRLPSGSTALDRSLRQGGDCAPLFRQVPYFGATMSHVTSFLRLSCWSLASIFVLTILVASEDAWGQEFPSSGGTVAVLNDGRVFQGSVQEVPGGYRILHAGGSTILPFDQISVTAATLVGAYEAFRDNIQKPDANAHLRLAEWCLANGLYVQAQIEVETALRLEPTRSDARLLYRQIDSILHPERQNSTTLVTQPAPQRQTAIHASAFVSTDSGTVTDISREAQLTYMRKVQPLLMNKCGNAHCHGGDKAGSLHLKLARFDSPGLKLASAHNQEVIFRFIDIEHPERSPLLVEPSTNSAHHKNLFFGPRNQAQFDIIDEWVKMVAAEKRANAPHGTPSSQLARKGTPSSGVLQTGATVEAPVSAPQLLPPGISQAAPLAPQSRQNEALPQPDKQLREEVQKSFRPDMFDPEEFNRMMHSRQTANE